MNYGTVQYSTVQYSTVQYSTVQYTTVYYTTARLGTCVEEIVPSWAIESMGEEIVQNIFLSLQEYVRVSQRVRVREKKKKSILSYAMSFNAR